MKIKYFIEKISVLVQVKYFKVINLNIQTKKKIIIIMSK